MSDNYGIDTEELKQVAEVMAPLQQELSVQINDLTKATKSLFADVPAVSTAAITSGEPGTGVFVY